MHLFSVIFLFLAVAVSAQSFTQNNIELQPIEESGQFAVAVMVHGKTSADRAIVTYQYWYEDATLGKLLLSRTAVVQVVPDVFVMADSVTATRAKIKRIDVVLVKDVDKHRFELGD